MHKQNVHFKRALLVVREGKIQIAFALRERDAVGHVAIPKACEVRQTLQLPARVSLQGLTRKRHGWQTVAPSASRTFVTSRTTLSQPKLIEQRVN